MASFSRVLGGLAVAGGCLLLVVVVVGGWAGLQVNSLHNTQAYTVSTAFLKSSKALRVQLGDDAQINPLVWGSVDSRLDGSGTATLIHVITSSKGLRFVTVDLEKTDNVWIANGASGDSEGAAFQLQPEPAYALVPHDPAKAIEALTRGDTAYDANDFPAAIREYDSAVALDPNNPACWLARGRAHGRQGDADQALADLDQAALLGPTNPDIWEALSWARLHSSHDREALESLNRLLELRPGDARGLGMRADANSKLGNDAAAREDAAAACQAGDSFACNLQQHLH
jgi:tetratricopeptide (TPR) repeat protein